MKIYSEKTKKFYETIKECTLAEKEFDAEKAKKEEADKKFRAEKKQAAEAINTKRDLVKAKFDEAKELQKEYYKEVEEFNKKYKEPVRTVVTTNVSNPWDLVEEAEKQLAAIDQILSPIFRI